MFDVTKLNDKLIAKLKDRLNDKSKIKVNDELEVTIFEINIVDIDIDEVALSLMTKAVVLIIF